VVRLAQRVIESPPRAGYHQVVTVNRGSTRAQRRYKLMDNKWNLVVSLELARQLLCLYTQPQRVAPGSLHVAVLALTQLQLTL
jgi:hypothetical protein